MISFCTEDILESFERWRHRETLPADADKKVSMWVARWYNAKGVVL